MDNKNMQIVSEKRSMTIDRWEELKRRYWESITHDSIKELARDANSVLSQDAVNEMPPNEPL